MMTRNVRKTASARNSAENENGENENAVSVKTGNATITFMVIIHDIMLVWIIFSTGATVDIL